jgi:hypothetical protein
MTVSWAIDDDRLSIRPAGSPREAGAALAHVIWAAVSPCFERRHLPKHHGDRLSCIAQLGGSLPSRQGRPFASDEASGPING